MPIGNSKDELRIVHLDKKNEMISFRPNRQFIVDGIKYSYHNTTRGAPGTSCIQPMFCLKDD